MGTAEPPAIVLIVMLSTFCVQVVSPLVSSLVLSGRTRQKTRIEPFKSSMMLWILRRRKSPSRTSSSETPTRFASKMASVSLDLESFNALMSMTSTCLASSDRLFTKSRIIAHSSNSLMRLSAWTTTGSSSGKMSLALAMASRSAPRELLWVASASSSRILCLGSSIARTSSAFLISNSSTPTCRACGVSNCKATTFFNATERSNASVARSFDSTADSSASNSERLAVSNFLTSRASFKALRKEAASPFSCASLSFNWACSIASSSARAAFASAMSFPRHLCCSALAIAARRPRTLGFSKAM
mmetsp:Transcript_69636/g.193816  ORF Transcript_69636/g.193816 Transcript_69636/m.193816 type:complete len:302 (+) Transcript_69636:997-1902(+)